MQCLQRWRIHHEAANRPAARWLDAGAIRISAFGASPTVLSDLWELMMNSKAAEGRRMLEPVASPSGRFYCLKMK